MNTTDYTTDCTTDSLLLAAGLPGGASGGDPYAVARSLLDNTATAYIDPYVTTLRAGAFSYTNCTVIRCHGVTSIPAASFMDAKVTALAFPALASTGRSFEGAKELLAVDLGPNLNTINGACFFNAVKLAAIVLRRTSVTALFHVNAFANTPFKSGGTGGTIYIPRALYDHLGDGTPLDYKAATNWSTVDGYGTITWAPIEGSVYETQYADGTPIA